MDAEQTENCSVQKSACGKLQISLARALDFGRITGKSETDPLPKKQRLFLRPCSNSAFQAAPKNTITAESCIQIIELIIRPQPPRSLPRTPFLDNFRGTDHTANGKAIRQY